MAIAAAVLWDSSAHAAQNDLVLSGLSYFDASTGRFKGDQAGFESLARELGLAFMPQDPGPASTTGEAGFEIGITTTLNTINHNSYYWKNTVEGGTPSDLLTTMQFKARKGLPYSFELGVLATYLFLSRMYALGAELKWAINEGFYYAPDIAISGAVNRVLGSRDLDMTTAGVNFMVSKTFGILGTCKLTPYAGYNFAMIWAGSRVLNGSPGDTRDDGGSIVSGRAGLPPDQFAFSTGFLYNSRGFLGLLFNAYFIALGFDATLAAGNLYSFTFKLGFDY